MSPIEAILRSVELGHLAEVFAQEGVTLEDVLQLEEPHLSQLGVSRLGDRVRLRRAAEEAFALPPPDSPAAPLQPADRALMGVTRPGIEEPAPGPPVAPLPPTSLTRGPSALPLSPGAPPQPIARTLGEEDRRARRREDLRLALEAWARSASDWLAVRREGSRVEEDLARAEAELSAADPEPLRVELELARARSRQANESTVTFLRRLVRKEDVVAEEEQLEQLERRHAEQIVAQQACLERRAGLQRALSPIEAALADRETERSRALLALAARLGEDPWAELEQIPMVLRSELTELFLPMKRVAPQRFWMGSPETEPDRFTDETLHEVTLTKPFALAPRPVTQGLWSAVMGQAAGRFVEGPDAPLRPVEGVSWMDAVRFCNALSARLALTPAYRIGSASGEVCRVPGANGFRLPTEAEWECAARAGTPARYAGGDDPDRVGWFKDNSHRSTHPVAMKKANAWGFTDMSGNVAEWCEDVYAPGSSEPAVDPEAVEGSGQRVVRGGSWRMPASHLRVAARYRIDPTYALDTVGFRVARSLV
jgi:sulfatase modifying factor 1